MTWVSPSCLSATAPHPWPIDGTPRRIRFAGTEVEAPIQDELGKIDSNASSEQTLQALFIAAGARASEAQHLTDTLIDWRDMIMKRIRTERRAAYLAAGYCYGPIDRPFESVTELDQLLLGSRKMVQGSAPVLSVHTRQPFIEPAVAPLLPRMTLGQSDTEFSNYGCDGSDERDSSVVGQNV